MGRIVGNVMRSDYQKGTNGVKIGLNGFSTMWMGNLFPPGLQKSKPRIYSD